MKRLYAIAAAVLTLAACAPKGEAPEGMVRIPGGVLTMGSEGLYQDEMPVHQVKVNSFYMDEKPVTNAQYKAFCDATGRRYPGNPRWEGVPDYFLSYPDHPVVFVSWGDAKAYAEWAGKRLPTEEEWEWAARGGLKGASYPWGNEAPDGKKLNFSDKCSEFQWRDNRADDGYAYTSPVGSYEPNAYGLYDMAGNVCEWVEDWFFPYSDTVHDTEAFKDGWGGSRVCRGGCFHSPACDVTVSRRRQILGGGGNDSVGFRCVKDLEGTEHQAAPDVEYITSPAGWDEKLLQMNVTIPKGNELCIGMGAPLNPLELKKLKCMGVTSVEQYVTWESVNNGGEDVWDFSVWDAEVAKLKEAGLKWLPFVIAGPAYSLPDWYRSSRDFEGLTCYEHNIESKIQTLWDKNFYKYIDRFLKAFSDHYKDKSIFEGIMFGICGDFGEAIVSVWHGNWPQAIPGMYHAHSGYWCQDRFAKADFRGWAEKKFGNIAALNESWGTSFPAFAAVDYPPIVSTPDNFRYDENTAPGSFVPKTVAERRRWIDFIDWYRQSMTDYVSFWTKTGRKYFPNNELYLCTGGDAVPWHASEFAQQCKAMAEYGGGVRITNEASHYTANFNVTNWVSSAGNFYGGYFSFEPAGQVTERGVVCRVYNAAATGAKSLHYYSSNILGNEERATNFASNVHFLREGGIRRRIGVLYPDTPMVLNTARYGEMNAAFALLRDYTDYTYVCDLTVSDGILDTIDALIIPVDGYYKSATLEKIKAFADRGGMIAGVGLEELKGLDDDADYMKILFGEGHTGRTTLLKAGLSAKVESTGTASNYRITYGDRSEIQKGIFDNLTAFFAEGGLNVSDGILDDVFSADRTDGLLIMNYSGKDVKRSFTYPDGKKVEADVPDLTIMELKF